MDIPARLTTRERTTQPDRFVITLKLDPNGNALVRSCEILGVNFRNRTSFGEDVSVDEAFVTQVACGIKSCLEKLSKVTEVLALVDHVIETPGLALMSPRIMATKVKDGSINVIMRFNRFLGSVIAAFKDNLGLGDSASERSSELSARILSDIAAPLLDICTAKELDLSNVSGRLGKFGQKIAERSHEIRFQTELLKRFVAQQPKKFEHMSSDRSSYLDLPASSLKN